MKKNYTLKQLEKVVVRQQDQSDCAVAALRTVISWHGGQAFSEDIRIASGTNTNGTTMLGLYQAASAFGLDAEGYEMDLEHLIKQDVPCILHLLLDEQRLHYMVYLGFISEKKQLILGDPAFGTRLLSPDELCSMWISKSALLFVPNNKFSTAKKSLRSEKRVWFIQQICEDLPLLGISVVLGIFISVIGLSTAIFSQKLIDQFLPAKNNKYTIVGLILLFILLLSRSLLSYLRQHIMLKQSLAYNQRLTGYFIEKILRLPKAFYDSRKSGDMIARLHDTQRIQQNINYIIGNVVIDLLISLISLIAIFIYSAQVGFVVLASIPFVIALIYRYTATFTHGQREVMSSYAMTESYYMDTLQGIATIKENHAHQFFANSGKNIFSIYQRAIFNLGQYVNLLTTKTDVFASFITVVVIATATHAYYRGQVSIGSLIAMISLVSSILPAVVRLAQISLQVQEMKVAFDRMYDLTNTKEEMMDDDARFDGLDFEYLHLEDVSFRFKGQVRLFEHVNLQIHKGELIGVVGYSGIGKSTLLQIIQGLYLPDEGKAVINGLRRDDLQFAWWKTIYATVPQDVKLFNGNIYSNVVIDKPCSLEEFDEFCQKHGFSQFFSQLPMGYLTPVGDDGVKLSGGQKQILAVARALYKKPQLLLLDEATSALDAQTESFILNLVQVLKNEKQMAILFITHRSIIHLIADRLYILRNGTLEIATSTEMVN